MKKVLFFLCVITHVFLFGQIKITDFSEGIYNSINDFDNRVPNKSNLEYEVKISGGNMIYKFYDKENNKKIKNVFAIFHNNELYINIKGMLKNFSKDSGGYGYDGGNYFLKASQYGEYLYFKDYFTNNTVSFTCGLLGGIIGGVIVLPLIRGEKAIIYQEDKNNFKLIKNVGDFKKFIKKTYPNVNKTMLTKNSEENKFDFYQRVLTEISK